jgi:phosphoribosylformylglycinamidine synthase
VIDNLAHVTTSFFKDGGDSIVLLETAHRDAGSIDLAAERTLQKTLRDAIQAGLVKSAHDISEGGLAIAIAECCYSTMERPSIGANITIPADRGVCKDLFGEYASRIIVSTLKAKELVERAGKAGLRASEIGRVGGERLVLSVDGHKVVDLAIDELETVWRRAFPKLLS